MNPIELDAVVDAVVDRDGDVWLRCGDGWYSTLSAIQADENRLREGEAMLIGLMRECGPLTRLDGSPL